MAEKKMSMRNHFIGFLKTLKPGDRFSTVGKTDVPGVNRITLNVLTSHMVRAGLLGRVEPGIVTVTDKLSKASEVNILKAIRKISIPRPKKRQRRLAKNDKVNAVRAAQLAPRKVNEIEVDPEAVFDALGVDGVIHHLRELVRRRSAMHVGTISSLRAEVAALRALAKTATAAKTGATTKFARVRVNVKA